MRVNRQIVKATIDGMSVPISLAMRRLHNGSAIPAELEGYQGWEGFSFESIGSGIFRTTIPDVLTNNTGAVWTQQPGTRAEGWRIFNGGEFTFSFGGDELGDRLRKIRKARDEEPLTTTSGPITDKINLRPVEVYKTACDNLLASIFGDKNSWVSGSGIDTNSFTGKLGQFRQSIRMSDVIGAGYPSSWGHTRGYSIHLYAQSATQMMGNANGNVYVPNGFFCTGQKQC